VLKQYRQLWDSTYRDPEANGLSFVYGGWNPEEKRQMFFRRVEGWLDKHFAKGHGIKVGATESGTMSVVSQYPSQVAVWYASMLGTFADHGGELFTPWMWDAGMWETLHLFSRYARIVRVHSSSSLDTLVSAYSSITPSGDSMTVILVNRDGTGPQTVNASLKGFVPAGSGTTLQLSGLSGETFVSHTENALNTGTLAVTNGNFSLTLPAYSVTAVRFGTSKPVVVEPPAEAPAGLRIEVDRVIARPGERIALLDVHGRVLRSGEGEISLRHLPAGVCLVRTGGRILPVSIP